jgi:iron-only hydrogenase group A
MEEASELVERIKQGHKLPMFTSCSPGWIKFVEQFYPEFIENISTCKSPQQMLGAIIKNFYAQKIGIDPHNIVSVAIMPCTAKKFEASKPEMLTHGKPDIDLVLTTRELARLFMMTGIDLSTVNPDVPDNPFGERSTAGKLFGVSGGVAEAALRTAHFLLTGKEMEVDDLQEIRGLDGIKEMKTNIGGIELGVAVVSGLQNARKLLDEIKNGRNDIHFVEVMTCPGGCIAGGGQPKNTDTEAVKARMKALYKIDKAEELRVSHKNKSIQKLYAELLEHPLSETSHKLLHTHFAKRDVMI